jgi:hypothetical protein
MSEFKRDSSGLQMGLKLPKSLNSKERPLCKLTNMIDWEPYQYPLKIDTYFETISEFRTERILIGHDGSGCNVSSFYSEVYDSNFERDTDFPNILRGSPQSIQMNNGIVP